MAYTGLSDKEVSISRKKYGDNSISKLEKDSLFKIILETLSDPIIKIFLIALGIKVVFLFKWADIYEVIGIFLAIIISSLISSLSEYGSEKTFERMEAENDDVKVKVIRNGSLNNIHINEVVVDDICLLEGGDKVPADGIIIEGSISVDESSLTGETVEINKRVNDKVFRSSSVYEGKCFFKVTSVGDNTHYGTVAREVQIQPSESPLKLRLGVLAKSISKIGYVGAILVSFSYLFKVIIIDNNFDYDMIISMISNTKELFDHIIYALTLSVTIMVVSVPEGLPMMVALVLSSNMKRMLKRGVLVRKLVGIETSGSLNILFTDKTGTLTKGEFTINSFLLGNGLEYDKDALKFNEIMKFVNDSILYNTNASYNNGEIIGGNITDKCLLKYIGDIKKNKTVTDYIPFNSENKYSKVTLDNNATYIKGAREILIPKCKYYLDINGNKKVLNTSLIENKIKSYEFSGNRVICLIMNNLPYENDEMTLIGLIILKDEVRDGVKQSVKTVLDAGVQVVMITGDNKDTATSIAKEVGIINSSDDIVLTSSDLNKLTDNELKSILPKLKVLARLLPKDKTRLIRVSKEVGLVSGMTGDGVNDAPALRSADVGFCMGSGSEIAKEASDIVIINNDFSSICSAILFGRTIFKSIRKFIIFQLTVNMCAITLSILGPFILDYTPVTVIQMLWINMVMDTLAGLAYAYEPPLKEYMYELPKKREEKILNNYMKSEIFITGLYTSILCIYFLKSEFIHSLYRVGENDKYFLTAFFGLFIFASIFNSFNARTHRLNLLSHINKNKVFLLIISFIVIVQLLLIYYGGELFRTTGLTFIELYITIFLSFTVVIVDLIRKIGLRFFGKKGGV